MLTALVTLALLGGLLGVLVLRWQRVKRLRDLIDEAKARGGDGVLVASLARPSYGTSWRPGALIVDPSQTRVWRAGAQPVEVMHVATIDTAFRSDPVPLSPLRSVPGLTLSFGEDDVPLFFLHVGVLMLPLAGERFDQAYEAINAARHPQD